MRSRPWPIVILALLFCFAPLLNAFFSAWLEGLSVLGYLNVFLYEASWLEMFDFFVLFPAAGVAIYLCKRWSYFIVLAVATLNVCSNYDTWRTYPKYFPGWLFVTVVILAAIVVGYFLLPAVKIVYMDPRLRWWESKPRYLVSGESVLRFGDREERARVTDISEGGVFVATQAELQRDTVVSLECSIAGESIDVNAKIVYRRGGEMPGYGVQFVSPSSDEKKAIRKLIKILEQRGAPVRTPFDWKKDLREWFHTLLHTGRGLIPRTDAKK